MGNYRFKLSDMMPNAWFYKLRDMGKSRNQKPKRPVSSTRTTKTATTSGEREFSMPRYSYYYTTGERFYASPVNLKASDTHFPDPPRRSKKVRNNKNRNHRSSKHISSSVSAGCSCRTSLESVWNPDDDGFESSPENSKFGEQFDKGSIEWSRSCGCRVSSSSTDIIIDMERKSCRKFDVLDSPPQFSDITTTPEIELPPILTKPAKFNDLILDIKKKESESESEPILGKPTSVNLKSRAGDGDRINHGSLSVKLVKKGSIKSFREQRSPLRKSSSLETASFGKTGSPTSVGMKIKNRANSPRLASKKIQAYNRKVMMTMNSKSRRKSFSESIAIVKSSYDPQRDFRDSMVEMIMGHNIRSSKDLEELLACYLSLNSHEYHDVIVKVFEQVWFNLPDIRL